MIDPSRPGQKKTARQAGEGMGVTGFGTRSEVTRRRLVRVEGTDSIHLTWRLFSRSLSLSSQRDDPQRAGGCLPRLIGSLGSTNVTH